MLAGEKGGEEEDQNRYPAEPPQLPQYDISPSLKKLTLMFIGAMLINFIIDWYMRNRNAYYSNRCSHTSFDRCSLLIQHNEMYVFYSLLTSHGQVMFFGVVSMNTMWFGYYATSKWGRKPLCGMKWAKISFWVMEGSSNTDTLITSLRFWCWLV